MNLLSKCRKAIVIDTSHDAGRTSLALLRFLFVEDAFQLQNAMSRGDTEEERDLLT